MCETYRTLPNLAHGCFSTFLCINSFEQKIVDVIAGKDRVVTLPDELIQPLKIQMNQTRILHLKDKADGYGSIEMPFALAKKWPNANIDFQWQYFTPSLMRSINPHTQQIGRHHVHEQSMQRRFKQAVSTAKIPKHPIVTPGVCQHSCAINQTTDSTRFSGFKVTVVSRFQFLVDPLERLLFLS